MKRILIIAAVMGLFVIGATAATALADKPPAPPGQGECDHGNGDNQGNAGPCKEDPQPEHGKECKEHGPKEGGVNEDHCKGEETTTTGTTETTTTQTTQTTTTSTQPTTPTTPATPGTPTTPATPGTPANPTAPAPTPTQPQATTPTTPSAPPAVVPPKAKPPAVVTKKKLEKELEKQAKKNGATPTAAKQPAGELPNTGLPLGLVALLGLGLMGSGLKLRRM